MACYHPLKAIVVEGSQSVKNNVPTRKRVFKFLKPFEVDKYPADKIIQIPCGQCVGCRIQYSREWANRCMMELQYHDSSYFVTLTYDDAHVPRAKYLTSDASVSALTGELLSEPEFQESLTLRKRDFQLFMKRLRKKFHNQKIRFFMAGEYGSNTLRPHYHAIIFGLRLDDLQLYSKSPQGFCYYNSPSLQSCWSDKDGNPIGYAVVAEVTWETCAYTARYVMKKQTGKDAEFYTRFNMQPEFTLMSRKPGIARQYYDDHPDIYKKEYINVSTEKGGLKFKPPRYFDKLYDLENPEEMQAIKDIRQKLATEAQKAKLQGTSLYLEEFLEVQERAFENKIKSLRRDII